MMKKTVLIEGMSCGHCVKRVEAALKEVSGVKAVAVDLAKKSATVEGDALDDAALMGAVTEAGYQVSEIIG